MSIVLRQSPSISASAAAKNYVLRCLNEFSIVFAMPRDPEPEVLRGTLINWGLGAAVTLFALLWVAFSDFRVDVIKTSVLLIFLLAIAVGCFWVRARLRLQTPPALVD